MKKKLITAALLSVAALALVVASVLGTIAFLTSSSKVSNVFTVGKVSIEMTEAAVNENGEYVSNVNNRTDRNSYHLVPGEDYIKDPTIFIKNDLNNNDNMYLFVKSSNGIRWIEEGNFDDDNDDNDNNSMRKQMENNGWIPVLRSKDGMEIVWVYGTRDSQTGEITPAKVNKTSQQSRKTGVNSSTLGPAGQFLLCSEFTIHQDADVSTYGGASVDFTAYAVQTTGLPTGNNPKINETAKAAWEAIKASINYEHGIANPVNPYDADEPLFGKTTGDFSLANSTTSQGGGNG